MNRTLGEVTRDEVTQYARQLPSDQQEGFLHFYTDYMGHPMYVEYVINQVIMSINRRRKQNEVCFSLLDMYFSNDAIKRFWRQMPRYFEEVHGILFEKPSPLLEGQSIVKVLSFDLLTSNESHASTCLIKQDNRTRFLQIP